MITNPNYRLFERSTTMPRELTPEEREEYRQEANEENFNRDERRRRIPRNTDPYYPEDYHIADHTPEEGEEE